MSEPPIPFPSDRKADRIVSHCVYRIGTGKWSAGERLPSVREAEKRWGVDRRTVLEGYRRLADAGLIESRNRSGFFVAAGPELGRVARHRHELEHLFDAMRETILAKTDLSPLGVFRYFAQLAAIRAGERPEAAFVECTATQAQGHVREIAARLGTPCLALTIDEVDGRRARVPREVRTLLVSRFHYGELRGLESDDLRVVAVPIEVSPALTDDLPATGQGLVFESDAEEAHDIMADVEQLGVDLELGHRVVDRVESELEGLFDAREPADLVALLSPRLWGNLDPRWRAHPNVRQIAFRVREEAWPAIADAIGLPLGILG